MPTTSIAVYDSADLVQRAIEYLTSVFSSAPWGGGTPYPITVLRAVDAQDGGGAEFGFPVYRVAMDNPAAMFDTRRKQLLWFRPHFGSYDLTEADLLKERPWYHVWQIFPLGTPHPEWWEIELLPAIQFILQTAYSCTITIDVDVRQGPQAGYVKYAHFRVGDDPDGHSCFTAILMVHMWKQDAAITSVTLNEQVLESTQQTYGDFDGMGEIGAFQTISTPRGDGDTSDAPIGVQLTEIILTLRDQVAATKQVADRSQEVAFNNGGAIWRSSPTEVIEGGG